MMVQLVLMAGASPANLFNKVGFVPWLVGVCLGWRCFYFYLDVPARWIAIGKGNRLHLRNAHTPRGFRGSRAKTAPQILVSDFPLPYVRE